MNKCECCGDETSLLIIDDDVKYIICHNCVADLFNKDLSSDQFFSLLESGHDTKEFLLHSCYYDNFGNALQPRVVTK